MQTDFVEYSNFQDTYNPAKNTTMNIISLYEKTAIMGLRMQQIAKGASSTLPRDITSKMTSLQEIVDEEYRQKKIPFIICRKLPDNTCEFWKIEDLIDVN
jgi:DNA-directed RNA polymerase I, II, and III subunit RPABC2